MEVGIYWYQNMDFIGSKNGLVGCVFTSRLTVEMRFGHDFCPV